MKENNKGDSTPARHNKFTIFQNLANVDQLQIDEEKSTNKL
jgi:hypothetical protein